jgi:TPR repeat protein
VKHRDALMSADPEGPRTAKQCENSRPQIYRRDVALTPITPAEIEQLLKARLRLPRFGNDPRVAGMLAAPGEVWQQAAEGVLRGAQQQDAGAQYLLSVCWRHRSHESVFTTLARWLFSPRSQRVASARRAAEKAYANELLRQAAEQKEPAALYEMSVKARERGNIPYADDLLREAAYADFAPAQFDCAQSCLRRDAREAGVCWLRRASNQGHREALYLLGMIERRPDFIDRAYRMGHPGARGGEWASEAGIKL